MIFWMLETVILAIDEGVSASENKDGVTLFTLSSVHWAESNTETNNV